jgi:hypothetical protein
MGHIPTASYTICSLCCEHVALESAKTDERGSAVHEGCYVQRIAMDGEAPRRRHTPTFETES